MADVFIKLEERLENPERLLKQLGILGKSASIRSFSEQRLGEFAWPAKYGGTGNPFLNMAGAIEDFNSGRSTPKADRLKERPALMGEGERGGLKASVDYRVDGKDAVEIGSNKDYATLMHRGGRSAVTLSLDGRARFVQWLGSKRSVSIRGKFGEKPTKKKPSEYVNNVFVKRMLASDSTKPYVHMITVAARPFVGVDDRLREEMLKAVERYFERGEL